MKISILTTVTNPEARQDRYEEALSCYEELADEVVIVDGSLPPEENGKTDSFGKTKVIYLNWPDEWNWIELPRHLNAGREQCTGDWIIKLDIDQFIHESDFEAVRVRLADCPSDCQIATFQKISLAYGKKHYQKGPQPIAFKNLPSIAIGKNLDKDTDLCFAIQQTGVEVHYKQDPEGKIIKGESDTEIFYNLPIGKDLKIFRTGIEYWNYDYFFKTKEFTIKEFWRFSRAYHRYFDSWKFGDSEEASFKVFLDMCKGRRNRAPYDTKLEDRPKYIREAVEALTPEQFGYDGWGLL